MSAPRRADDRGAEIQRVLHVARGVIGRHVQRFEVVEVVLDLGSFENLVAHVGEDVLDLLADLHQRMHVTDGPLARGQRDVNRVGGWTGGRQGRPLFFDRALELQF